jgi:hypothetical protein
MEDLFILVPIIALTIPIAGIAFSAFKRWADLKEKQLETQTNQTAEKAAQYRPTRNGLNSGCGCWSGSLPTRAWTSPTK